MPKATAWPCKVRSREHPHGLPELQAAGNEALLETVRTDNEAATITFAVATAACRAGLGIAIESPENSFFWELAGASELTQLPGMLRAVFSTCMFDGEDRNRRIAVVTNVVEIYELLNGAVCGNRRRCDRTGAPHSTWEPLVAQGRITQYPSARAMGHSVALCDRIAEGVDAHLHTRSYAGKFDIGFSEVYAGEQALLSARVLRRLAHGAFACSS